MHPTVRTLLTWYRANARDLPWRKTRNSYRIFISELMLQQTQVDRVLLFYRRWLKTFPSWKTLAEAKTADLVHAWAGLGYNRRALYAREAARDVMRHGVPTDETRWRRLKGVGPYMAAALAEFASGKRAVVIDTNVRRVIGRVFFGIPHPTPVDDPRIRRILERITPSASSHYDFPQASMDLAGAICTPKHPRCDICPLKTSCRAAKKFRSGKTLPKKINKKIERIHRDKPYPDRIYRGKILSWIRENGPTSKTHLGPRVDPTYDPTADRDWIEAICDRLVKDGFLVIDRKNLLRLPSS